MSSKLTVSVTQTSASVVARGDIEKFLALNLTFMVSW